MNAEIADLMGRIRGLESELESAMARGSEKFALGVRMQGGLFEERLLKKHRELKTGLLRYVTGAPALFVLTAPVIYSLIVPFVLLDLLVTVYQSICFPVYGIRRIKRHSYFAVDRHHLAYLNALEKVNCAYCSYANGLLAYVREIASVTEQYWCPIKHARRVAGTHERYPNFTDYGDGESYREQLEVLRKELRE